MEASLKNRGSKRLPEDRKERGVPTPEKIRVIVADDHPFVRIGIRKILSKTRDISVVGEASNGEEAIKMVEDLRPDILLLDVEMPVMNGIQVADYLHQIASPVRILVLSAYEDRQHIQGMLNGGVSGYLTKEEVPEILVKAVQGIAAGQKFWVSESLAEKMKSWEINPPDKVFVTDRQLEILRLLSQKRGSQEIADILNIPKKTVEKHLDMLCNLFGLQNVEDLIHFAYKNKIV
jgi:DNA-binding NarL/FixJ family response regulator